ncbi:LuxR C-terminal-related transcriptional regulator [Agromyces sp. MMS24-K17]|uniref:helix-turn-helix transcriptional regulator n=1 Tax=Agromyces sp. MMS24-K17 TaxID=3372850 RepID=UPI0037553D74
MGPSGEGAASARALALDEAWPLIGRTSLVGRGVAGLSNGARTLFAYGPSGIGKSRLVRAIADGLADGGRVVVPLSGNPALSAVPLAALAPALAREPGSLVSAAADPVGLFASAAEAIRAIGGGREVVAAVDDITVVDPVSATLLAQLVEAGVLRLAATVREGDPLPDALLAVASAGDSVRLDVPPLDVDEVGELLALVLGGPVAHRDAVELHRAAQGNPLYLRELAIGAHRSGALVEADGLWQLDGEPVATPALRDLIQARLRTLGDAERDVVERLALCEPLAFDELARPGALEALASLELRGLIQLDESTPRIRVRLSHPHYAAAVRESMPRIRAMALLLEQADLLASRPTDPSDELRIAMWRLDAGRPSDPELLARSAGLARLAHDHRTAERLVAAAITAGATDGGTRLLHAQLLWSLGRGEEALAELDRADVAAAEAGAPPELVAAIASVRSDVFGGDPLGQQRGIDLLDEVQAVLPGQAATLSIAKSILLLNLERVDESLRMVDVAAGASGDSPTERAVLDLTRAMPLASHNEAAAAIDAASRAIAYTDEPGAVVPTRRAQLVLAHALIAEDRLADARATTLASLHDAIRNDDHLTARLDEFLMGRLAWQAGRLDTAARWFRDTVGGAELHGPASLREPALGFLAITAAEQGDAERAREHRARIVAGLEDDNSVTALADAWIHAAEGDVEAAARVLLARVDVLAPRGAVYVATGLLHHLTRIGTRAHAAVAAERLAALPATGCAALGRRLAHARAEASGDPIALRAAGEAWEAIGHLLYAAEAFASAGNAAKAAGLGREATADLQYAATLSAACEGARTPKLTFSDGAEPLTPREREIASLAAQGLSSNEIATRLFLSPRTVNNHLQSTYAKLGIRGRHELRTSPPTGSPQR